MADNLFFTARALACGNPWAFSVWLDSLTESERALVWANLVIEPIQKAWDALRPVLEVIIEAVKRMIEVIRKLVSSLFKTESGRRLMLYCKLRRWRFPDRLAFLAAKRWPRRWLPSS
jgi:hypothetical protein